VGGPNEEKEAAAEALGLDADEVQGRVGGPLGEEQEVAGGGVPEVGRHEGLRRGGRRRSARPHNRSHAAANASNAVSRETTNLACAAAIRESGAMGPMLG